MRQLYNMISPIPMVALYDVPTPVPEQVQGSNNIGGIALIATVTIGAIAAVGILLTKKLFKKKYKEQEAQRLYGPPRQTITFSEEGKIDLDELKDDKENRVQVLYGPPRK